MKKQNIIMYLQTSLAALLLFFALEPSTLADHNGRISHLTYSPQEIAALQDMTISIQADNPSSGKENYVLRMQIVKDGKLVNQQEYTFSLDRGRSITLTPTYTPQSIGEYQIVVKLLDEFKVDIFDTQFITFNSVSHIGPFDIVVDPLTTRVRPGYLLPVRISLVNQGTKSTDVQVQLVINCPDQQISQSFTTFVGGNNKTDQLVSIDTCQQEGLYEIVGSVMLFNKTWITSSSQFFVNSSFAQLQFQVPDKIVLNPGESYSFPVEVTNLGNQKVTDLKFIILKVPPSWQTSSPTAVAELKPTKTAIFIVNITIPKDAEPSTYEARMDMVANEVLERHISTLQVIPLQILPSSGIPINNSYLIMSIVTLSGLVGSSIIYKIYRKRKSEEPSKVPNRVEILNKLRRGVQSSELATEEMLKKRRR